MIARPSLLLLVSSSLFACGEKSTESSSATLPSSPASSLAASGSSSSPVSPRRSPPVGPDFAQDMLDADLDVDIGAMTARAKLRFKPSPSGVVSFEKGDLDVKNVADDQGAKLAFVVVGDRLDVVLGPGDLEAERAVVVDYAFHAHRDLDGWDPTQGNTFLWPHFCGNFYPCKSDPTDGLTFSVKVSGGDPKLTYLAPARIPADAPPYMVAIAAGAFDKVDLGATKAGTSVSVWARKGELEAAKHGTKHLVAVFDFYERTYGPYTFGRAVGSVSVDWGEKSYGGMEHHPYWHIAKPFMADEYTHAHEAAHGWFGDGVRIGCWEDFVLSEGTASYIAARALEESGVDAWKTFGCDLRSECASKTNTTALPDTCDKIDIRNDPLFSPVPYNKGAFFYRAVAELIGKAELDGALAAFYKAHVGKSAHMTDMIAFLETKGDHDKIAALARDWLSTLACPNEVEQLCQSVHF